MVGDIDLLRRQKPKASALKKKKILREVAGDLPV